MRDLRGQRVRVEYVVTRWVADENQYGQTKVETPVCYTGTCVDVASRAGFWVLLILDDAGKLHDVQSGFCTIVGPDGAPYR